MRASLFMDFMSQPELPVDPTHRLEGRRLRFDRMEWAGSLGDIGTLIPFLVAYIVVAGVPAMGILFCFGVAMIVCGLYYRTPFPVQPMKAAGAVVATQASSLAISVQAIYCASLLTGVVWLLLAMTGLAARIAALVSRPVVIGIVLFAEWLTRTLREKAWVGKALNWSFAAVFMAFAVTILTAQARQ